MSEPGALEILVIGLGNDFRGDDAVGRVVVRQLRDFAGPRVGVREESGEGATLIEAWKDAETVILVDAVHSGIEPGTIHRLDARAQTIPSQFFHYSTHAFSLAEAVELARALNLLPPRLIIYGIEGKDFLAGQRLSPEVEDAAEEVARRVRNEIKELIEPRSAC